MIDNLAYNTKDKRSIQNAYFNTSLIFIKDYMGVNKKTGEIFYIHTRKYLNLTLTFLIKDDKNIAETLTELTVRGSVHTLFNNGQHNANFFTFKDLETTLINFSEKFGIDLEKCILKPFEYGNNLHLSEFSNYDAREIVLNTYCEQRKMFQPNVPGVNTSIISGSSNNEMRSKVYTKSDDCPEYCKNTIRTETQQKKIRDLYKKGIKKVTDLFKIENQVILFEKHINYMKQLVIYDYTINVPKNSKFKKDVINFSNRNYWIKLIEGCKKSETHNTKYNEKVSDLRLLSKKHGTNLLGKLIQQAEKQWFKAIGNCNYSHFTRLKKPKNARVLKPKNAQLYNTCIDIRLMNGFTLTSYSDSIKKTSKKCIVTGVDISMQKDDSNLLSNTGLKYIENNNPKLFNRLINKYITGRENQYEKTIYGKLSKQIRNKFYNNRSDYNLNQLGLGL